MSLEEWILQQVPTAGAGGLMGVGGTIGVLKWLKVFATPQDNELSEERTNRKIAELKAEIAEKYVTKPEIKAVMENLDYIRHRVDELADKRS